jgi:uncharacterized membrane protein YphA (DoxX/SURF4 family)
MTCPRIDTFDQNKRHLQWINSILCVLLSLVFLTAAIAKTTAYRELEGTLGASRLVPVPAIPFAAVFLLSLEYLLSVLVLLPTTRLPALRAATVLVSVFAAYSTWRWMQGISVPCHCFGVLFKLDPWQALILNGVLIIALAHLTSVFALMPRDRQVAGTA